MEKGIIYYTDNQISDEIAIPVQEQLKKANLPIVCSSLQPMSFGDKHVIIKETRGYHAYFKQIIAALEASTAEVVFFCEHDVLYHPSYFEFIPVRKDLFYYNLNVWRLRYPENFAVAWDANQVAELCCYRELALEWYKIKLKEYENPNIKFDRKFEPEGKNRELFENWQAKEANIDIRREGKFGNNLTKSKWSLADFRDKSTCINWREGRCPDWAKEVLKV